MGHKENKGFSKKIVLLSIFFILILTLGTSVFKNIETIKQVILNAILRKNDLVKYDKGNIKNIQKIPQEIPKVKSKEAIIITEIFPGGKEIPPFIKIFNRSEEEIDLSGLYIKKINGNSGKESYLVSKKLLNGIKIKPFSYISISKENNKIISDIYWPKTYNIPKSGGIVIYNQNGEEIEKIMWDNLPTNLSMARVGFKDKKFVFTPPVFSKN
jgi:hypothetical protein